MLSVVTTEYSILSLSFLMNTTFCKVVLASAKAELCARLDDMVSASWDFTFLFTEDFADNKGVYKKYDRYV